MYDYFIGKTKFHGFKDKINDILEGTYKEDIEKLGNDIYEAYEQGELSDGQYDYLSALLEDCETVSI